jgi:hypothetical protein
MKKIGLSLIAAMALGSATIVLGAAQAAPAALSAPQSALADANLLQKAQFIFGGRHFCFYLDGWNGPGWYWCGYSHRHGYGWGGREGWHGWYRHGHRHYHHHYSHHYSSHHHSSHHSSHHHHHHH